MGETLCKNTCWSCQLNVCVFCRYIFYETKFNASFLSRCWVSNAKLKQTVFQLKQLYWMNSVQVSDVNIFKSTYLSSQNYTKWWTFLQLNSSEKKNKNICSMIAVFIENNNRTLGENTQQQRYTFTYLWDSKHLIRAGAREDKNRLSSSIWSGLCF